MDPRWQDLMDILPHPALLVDGSLTVRGASRRAAAVFGIHLRHGAAGDLGARLTQAVAEERDLGDALALAGARLTRPEEEESFPWQTGERTYGVTVTPVADDLLLVVFADVTEATRAEEILQNARGYLEQIMDGVPLGVTVVDRALRLTAINREKLECLERRGKRVGLAEAIGATIEQVFPADEAAQLLAVCQGVLETGEAVQGERREHATASGKLVLVTYAGPLRDVRGRVDGVILTCADVTEQARLEEELLRAGKLATIGQMAITLNHEINNPLGIISSTAQSLRLLNQSLDEKTTDKLKRIEAQVRRIAEVTQRLRQMDDVRTSEYIESGPRMIDLWDGGPGGAGASPTEE